MSNIKICAIAAMAKNGVIGKDNKIPWHIPADFKHFKATTLGKPIIMGRKTWDSLGHKPLPGRANIVISRHAAEGTGATFVKTIDEAIQAAKDIATKDGVEEIFIIGGGEIYRQTLPQTDKIYLTVVDRDYEGDAAFAGFAWSDWNIMAQQTHTGAPAFTFYTLMRAPKD